MKLYRIAPLALALACCWIVPAVAAADDAELAARLQQLHAQPETPALRRWVEGLLDYKELSRLPYPERPGLDMPRYRVQAHARAVLQHWDEQAALQRLRAVPNKSLAPADSAAERRARADWLRQASPAELASFRADLIHDDLDEASLLALVQRQDEPDDWAALLATGGSRAVLEELALARDRLPPQRYARLLDLASSNPRLASSAARLRGQWALSNVQQREALQQALRAGPLDLTLIEAALAAELPALDALLTPRLYEPDAASTAAYGLWRLHSPEALRALSAYVGDPRADAALSQELQRWLD